MDMEILRTRCMKEFCIPVDEEYGYRQWIWFPVVSEAEIEVWWASLENLDWCPNECLPGEWIKEPEAQEEWETFYDLHDSLWFRKSGYALSCDGNLSGGLLTPKGKAIFHRGMEIDEPEKVSWHESALHRLEPKESK